MEEHTQTVESNQNYKLELTGNDIAIIYELLYKGQYQIVKPVIDKIGVQLKEQIKKG